MKLPTLIAPIVLLAACITLATLITAQANSVPPVDAFVEPPAVHTTSAAEQSDSLHLMSGQTAHDGWAMGVHDI
ncbi:MULTISPECIES: hypothetical protein [unclassified Marinovum]